MYVHPPLRRGIIAGNVVGDGGGGAVACLLERDGARDGRVSSEDGDCELESS